MAELSLAWTCRSEPVRHLLSERSPAVLICSGPREVLSIQTLSHSRSGEEELTEYGDSLGLLDDVVVEVVVGGACHLHLAQVDVDVEEKDAGGLPATLCDWDNLQSYE